MSFARLSSFAMKWSPSKCAVLGASNVYLADTLLFMVKQARELDAKLEAAQKAEVLSVSIESPTFILRRTKGQEKWGQYSA